MTKAEQLRERVARRWKAHWDSVDDQWVSVSGSQEDASFWLNVIVEELGITEEMVEAIRELAANEYGNTGDDSSDSLFLPADQGADALSHILEASRESR